MSEGKNVLVVSDHLNRLLVRTQLAAMGVSLDVIVQPEVSCSIVTDLLAQHETRDEMLALMKGKHYTGVYHLDHELLVENITKEFNDFCMFHKFKALRDSTIGKLNYELSQGPDGGGNPALQDSQREASVSTKAVDEIVPTLLTEMLKELKGIKQAVTPPTVKIDRGSDKALVDFLSTPQLSMPEIIEGLRAHFTQPIRVVGARKASLLEGLNRALGESKGSPTSILIESVDLLSPEEIVELETLFKVGIQDTTSFIGQAAGAKNILEKLIEAVSSTPINTIVLHDLKGINSQAKRDLYGALKAGLKKYEELEQTRKEFLVHGARQPLKITDVSLTLEQMAGRLCEDGYALGIIVDQPSLHSWLLTKAVTKLSGADKVVHEVGKIFKRDDLATVRMGNHTFERNEDGSLKIVTQLPNNTVSFVVLNVDGGVQLHGPGYLG